MKSVCPGTVYLNVKTDLFTAVKLLVLILIRYARRVAVQCCMVNRKVCVGYLMHAGASNAKVK